MYQGEEYQTRPDVPVRDSRRGSSPILTSTPGAGRPTRSGCSGSPGRTAQTRFPSVDPYVPRGPSPKRLLKERNTAGGKCPALEITAAGAGGAGPSRGQRQRRSAIRCVAEKK